MLVKCLYCDVDNDGLSTGGFCESCGKKLPASAMIKTRRTMSNETTDGLPERPVIPRQSKVVSEGLIAAAIVHLFAGGLFLIVGPAFFDKDKLTEYHFGPYVLAWAVVPTMVLGLLGLLARWTPIPAVTLALILAVIWVGVTFVLSPVLALGWLLVDAVLVTMLAWVLWRGMTPEKRAGA